MHPLDGCISFVSYIKPQHLDSTPAQSNVVYLSFPTSNHNCVCLYNWKYKLYIFRFLHQTTTVYDKRQHSPALYIFRFLHQTTTPVMSVLCVDGCISFVSYIKPQPWHYHAKSIFCCISFVSYIKPQPACICVKHIIVVYLSFPTSNHNARASRPSRRLLYIFRFLHQTTTSWSKVNPLTSCISFVSYIKPQLWKSFFYS